MCRECVEFSDIETVSHSAHAEQKARLGGHWLDLFPHLDEWKNAKNFDVQHALYDALYRDSESGSNAKFATYVRNNFTGANGSDVTGCATS